MDVDPILRSDPDDEMAHSLRKINELLYLIAAAMAPPAPEKPPVKD